MGIIKKNANVHPKDSKGLIHKAGNKYKYFLKVGQCTPWVYMWCTWSGVHFPAAGDKVDSMGGALAGEPGMNDAAVGDSVKSMGVKDATVADKGVDCVGCA